MNQALARSFNFTSLLRFAFPTIVMMVFMSLYTMVDGVFVSRFAGTSALSAVNIVYPMVSVVVAVGVMLATGGSAVIAKRMGESKAEQARQNFSYLILAGLLIAIGLAVPALIFLRPLLHLLGAQGALFQLCYDYAFPLVFFIPSAVLQMLFQTLLVTAGKPVLGLTVTILGGVANIVLDYLFIVPLDMGIAGAAVATGIGYSIPAVFGLLYFALHRKGPLCFVRPGGGGKMLLQCCANGSSEMVTNLSTAVTTFLFNLLMMRYAGEDGVASMTIVLYSQYLMTAVYLGYATGTAPVFSFHHGSRNKEQLRRLFRISMTFVVLCSVATFALALVFAKQIVMIFTPVGTPVFELALYGFRLFSGSFLFAGVGIFASAMFTAFSDGKVSAAISFLRTFAFIVLALLLLPIALGLDGVWLAVPVAETLGFGISLFFLCRKRKRYCYA